MYDYAVTYAGVGDLADQREAFADAEERLAPPARRKGGVVNPGTLNL